MATQAAMFADTIAGMKKAAKRKAYDSDSDSSIEQLTNRGNKLRKKARFVHEGQLALPSGPQVYKRSIEHAGYRRDIISRNPPIIDDDGYEVDSDDDDERARDAIAAAAELDPYSEVKIESLLLPLTAASDLADHPTLSKPFTSRTLTELTQHAGEMVQKEKASLWRIKHLLTKLSGDNTWYPCETVETDNDIALFIDERDRGQGNMLAKAVVQAEGDQVSPGTLASEDAEPERSNAVQDRPRVAEKDGALQTTENFADGDIVDGNPVHLDDTSKEEAENLGETVELQDAPHGPEDHGERRMSEGIPSGTPIQGDEMTDKPTDTTLGEQALQTREIQMVDGEPEEGEEEIPVPRRMRTRAQAQAASDNNTVRTRSASPESGNELFVHPFFLAPASSHPDRNVGLPPPEADETRRLLQLYIQKQEEVCRGAQKVYDGLLKADRYRKMVMKWSKAEAHVGANRDMSDGEDWYDKEEWGLDEDLKKGQDEEEEDAATTAKKTRTRRQ